MPDPLEAFLRRSPLTPSQRASVWDAYEASQDEDVLAASLESLGVPKQVKAQLWDMKASTARPAEPEQPVGFHAALAGAENIGPTPWHSQGIGGLVGMPGRGPSVRDALSVLPAAGGFLGGALASPGVITGVGGAALGGAGGEALKQLGERAIGVKVPDTSSEAATEIGTQGLVQGGAQLVGKVAPMALGATVRKILPIPEKQYAQALGATTNANKDLSAKIVPELIKRRVTGSREGIKELAEREIGKAGAALDDALAQVPKDKAADVGAVMNHLQKLKKQYVVPSGTPGANTIVDNGAYDSLGKMQMLVAGTQPTFESVRRLRQILDGMVTAGDKTFGRTIAEGSNLDATREAANAIRAELGKAAPNVARINKEFSFWMNVDRVVGDTIKRTASQSKGLGQQIAEGVAGPAVIGGLAVGGPASVAAGGTTAMVVLRKVLQSPQWKTFSAVQKDRLAEAIARGDVERMTALLAHGATAAGRSEQDD